MTVRRPLVIRDDGSIAELPPGDDVASPQDHVHPAAEISDGTATGRALITAANAAAGRTTLGLGGAAVLNVGTAAGTVAAGDDARLSDARTPTAHNHDASALTSGVLADGRLPERLRAVARIVTDWNAATENGCYMADGAANAPAPTGWFIGTVVAHMATWVTQTVHVFGADSSSDTQTWQRDRNNGTWSAWYRLRLSQAEQDARYAALSHAHPIADVTGLQAALDARILTTARGAANGVASLDASGRVPESQLPAIAIVTPFAVASEAAMLALAAQTGDIAIRSDINRTFVLSSAPATTLANWLELRTPTDAVLSVAGKTGAVTLAIADVASLQAALDAKLDDSQATAFGLSLLDDANAAAGRTTLGLGGAAVLNVGTAAGTVAAGDDARFSNVITDSRLPLGLRNSLASGKFVFNFNLVTEPGWYLSSNLASNGPPVASFYTIFVAAASDVIKQIIYPPNWSLSSGTWVRESLDNGGTWSAWVQVAGAITQLDARYAALSHAHPIADVTGLQAALDARILTTARGAANGVASLDAGGRVPIAQVPVLVSAQIGDGAVTAEKAAFGRSANMLMNHDFYAGLRGLVDFASNTTGTWTLQESFDPWRPSGLRGAYFHNPSSGLTGFAFVDLQRYDAAGASSRYPVIAGRRYEFTTHLSAHRCTGYIELHFFNAAGTLLGTVVSSLVTHMPSGAFSNWPATTVFGVAPAGTVTVLPRIVADMTAASNVYLFWSAPRLCEAGANQTEATPYSAAGATVIDGGQVVNATIANNKLAAMTASTIKGRAGTSGSPQDLTATQVRSIVGMLASEVTSEQFGIWPEAHSNFVSAAQNTTNLTTMQTASKAARSKMKFGSGVYRFTNTTIYGGAFIEGMGRDATDFRPVAGNTGAFLTDLHAGAGDPYQGTPTHLKDLRLRGNTTDGVNSSLLFVPAASGWPNEYGLAPMLTDVGIEGDTASWTTNQGLGLVIMGGRYNCKAIRLFARYLRHNMVLEDNFDHHFIACQFVASVSHNVVLTRVQFTKFVQSHVSGAAMQLSGTQLADNIIILNSGNISLVQCSLDRGGRYAVNATSTLGPRGDMPITVIDCVFSVGASRTIGQPKRAYIYVNGAVYLSVINPSTADYGEWPPEVGYVKPPHFIFIEDNANERPVNLTHMYFEPGFEPWATALTNKPARMRFAGSAQTGLAGVAGAADMSQMDMVVNALAGEVAQRWGIGFSSFFVSLFLQNTLPRLGFLPSTGGTANRRGWMMDVQAGSREMRIAPANDAGDIVETGIVMRRAVSADWIDAMVLTMLTASRGAEGGTVLLEPTEADASFQLRGNGAGRLLITDLPTSAAGLPSGTLWNDAGTPRISP